MLQYIVIHPNDIAHYGVLGMKWGMHKAAKRGTKYEYKSLGTKHVEREFNKLKRASNKSLDKKSRKKINDRLKIEKIRLDVYKEFDKNYQNYAKKTSVGKAIAQNILFGGVGARTYQQLRANGKSRAISVGASAVGLLVDPILSNLVVRTAPHDLETYKRFIGENKHLLKKKSWPIVKSS